MKKILLISLLCLFAVAASAYADLTEIVIYTPPTYVDVHPGSLILVVVKYALGGLGFLGFIFTVLNIAKAIKLKGTPAYDKKYARRIIYFLILMASMFYGLFYFSQNVCFDGTESFAGCIDPDAKEMEYNFPDRMVVLYECNGEIMTQIQAGNTLDYCKGDLGNVSCHLRIEDDDLLDFYHLEEIDCKGVKEEHPEVFY